MGIRCCKDCKDRHVGCHSDCKQYQLEKEEYEAQKEKTKVERSKVLSTYDFDGTSHYSKRHKR